MKHLEIHSNNFIDFLNYEVDLGEFIVRFDYEEFALKTIINQADLMLLEKYIADLACRIYTMQNEFEKYHVAGINRRDFAVGYNFSKLCDLAANLKAKIDS